MWEKGNPHTPLVGTQIGAASMENSAEVCQKINRFLKIIYSLPGIVCGVLSPQQPTACGQQGPTAQEEEPGITPRPGWLHPCASPQSSPVGGTGRVRVRSGCEIPFQERSAQFCTERQAPLP